MHSTNVLRFLGARLYKVVDHLSSLQQVNSFAMGRDNLDRRAHRLCQCFSTVLSLDDGHTPSQHIILYTHHFFLTWLGLGLYFDSSVDGEE